MARLGNNPLNRIAGKAYELAKALLEDRQDASVDSFSVDSFPMIDPYIRHRHPGRKVVVWAVEVAEEKANELEESLKSLGTDWEPAWFKPRPPGQMCPHCQGSGRIDTEEE